MRKHLLMLFLCLSSVQLLLAQNRTVTGIVTGADDGLALPGVNVLVKGTTVGTVTDAEGRFVISMPSGSTTLVFSFIGFANQEVAVGERSSVDVAMASDATQLSEVIVVAYGEQSKASFTGSAVSVSGDQIAKTPRSSFQESIQGTVAGVQASTPSGQPGSIPFIRVRGVGSYNASNTPLYVVDGIPVVPNDISRIATSANTLANINPNDIESFTVLKDASATSIYGSRAANGVILITTKSGKAGKTKFDFSAQYGISKVTIADKHKPLSTDELVELLVEGRVNRYGESEAVAQQWIYDRIDEDVSTSWYDEVTRTGKYSQYNLSASGGNEKTSFFTSVGIYNQEGTIIGVDYKRQNARLNLKHNATDKLSFNSNVSLSHQDLNTTSDAGAFANPVRSIYRLVPWEPVYNDDGSYNVASSFNSTYNPVALANESIRNSDLYAFQGGLGAAYDIMKNLTFESKGSLDFNYVDEFRFDPQTFGDGRNDNGRGYAYTTKYVNWNWTNLLRYSITLNDVHGIDVTLGQEAQEITRNTTNAYAANYGVPGLVTLSNASEFRDASSTERESSIASYFVSINYDYQGKYFVNLTGRRDGSSRFGRDVRYANFGSIGLAWNISKENFMSGVGFVNDLKLRTSYGINGNQDGIDEYASLSSYATGNDYNNQPGYLLNRLENPALTWEKNKPFNIGLDFEVLNHRLSGTFEYYSRTTSDLLFDLPISRTNGVESVTSNFGSFVNKGVEVTLTSRNIVPKVADGLSWETSFNFTRNVNEITELPGDQEVITGSYRRAEGTDYYNFYMVGYAGVDPDNGDALWYKDGTKNETTNNYGEAQRFDQGSGLPDFFGGMMNTISYKGITLSFQINYNWGNQIYDTWGRFTQSDGAAGLSSTGNMSRQVYDRRWQKPGDVTDMPKIVFQGSQSGPTSQASTRFLYDGSYIRLRDVTLGYNLPASISQKLRMNGVRIYAKGNNLLTWVKDDRIEQDPEVDVTGNLDQRVPVSRQVVFGIDLKF